MHHLHSSLSSRRASLRTWGLGAALLAALLGVACTTGDESPDGTTNSASSASTKGDEKANGGTAKGKDDQTPTSKAGGSADKPGCGTTEPGDPGKGDPGKGDPGNPGKGDPGKGDPGNPGKGDPGKGDPGNPGKGDPGKGDPGKGDSGQGGATTPTDLWDAYQGTCIDDSELKAYAAKICAGYKANLVELFPGDDCKPGVSSVAKIHCQGAESQPPANTDVWDFYQGTCIDDGELKAYAAKICAGQNANLVELYPADDCKPGVSSVAKIHCVGAVAEPPATTDLWDAYQGTCVDDGLLKEIAAKICAGQKANLIELYPADDCKPGVSSVAKIHCVGDSGGEPGKGDPGNPGKGDPGKGDPGKPGQGEPGDPGKGDSGQGGAATDLWDVYQGTCIDDSELKALAAKICAGYKANLVELFPGDDCKPGISSVAKIHCVGAPLERLVEGCGRRGRLW